MSCSLDSQCEMLPVGRSPTGPSAVALLARLLRNVWPERRLWCAGLLAAIVMLRRRRAESKWPLDQPVAWRSVLIEVTARWRAASDWFENMSISSEQAEARRLQRQRTDFAECAAGAKVEELDYHQEDNLFRALKYKKYSSGARERVASDCSEGSASSVSLWCVRVTKEEAVDRFLGGIVDLCHEMEQKDLKRAKTKQCLDLLRSHRVHVLCIMSSGSDGQPKGELDMNWHPAASTKLKLDDWLYIGGKKEGVDDLAAVVGELLPVNEKIKLISVPVPQHWVGCPVGRQTEKRQKGLNVRQTCGVQLLGLRRTDGSHVLLFPNADTMIEDGQEMLFLHSLASYPDITFKFNLEPTLVCPENFAKRRDSIDGGGFKGAVCPVCYEGLSDRPWKRLSCGHFFCLECVGEHLREHQVCPLCRKKVQKYVRSPTGHWVLQDCPVSA